jgi:hypothetical protein
VPQYIEVPQEKIVTREVPVEVEKVVYRDLPGETHIVYQDRPVPVVLSRPAASVRACERMRTRRFAPRWVCAVAKSSLYCRSRWSSSGSVNFIQIVIKDSTRSPLLVLTLPLLCRKRSFMSTSLTRSDIFVHARMGVACNFFRFFSDSQHVRICVFLVRVYVCALNIGRKDHDGGGGKGRHQGGASDGGENRHQGGMCMCCKCLHGP